MATQTLSLADDGSGTLDGPTEPCFVLAMDCAEPLAPPASYRLGTTDELVVVGRGDARGHRHEVVDARRRLRLDVADAWMSTEHFELVCAADGAWHIEDRGSKNGTRLNGRAVTTAALSDGDVVDAGRTLFVYREASAVAGDGDGAPRPVAGQTRLTTVSGVLRRDYERLARIAESPVPVLVYGESGTGKEIVARAVHEISGRSGPFVAVNCGALPQTLIESELFGSRKGAFSGATDREGLVRASHAGTLFLDEIAELPESSQATLLRVLQEREVLAVGATKPTPVDLRIVAATHRDLANRVELEAFRHDLYARLKGFELRMPRLADRREDIGLLIAALLPEVAGDRANALRFQLSAGRALLSHDWPYNVRELAQALQAAVAVCEGDELALDHLPPDVREPKRAAREKTTAPEDDRTRLVALLERHRGNVSAVARALETSRSHVRRLAERLGIDLSSYRR